MNGDLGVLYLDFVDVDLVFWTVGAVCFLALLPTFWAFAFAGDFSGVAILLLSFNGRFGVSVLINLGERSSITPSSTLEGVCALKLTLLMGCFSARTTRCVVFTFLVVFTTCWRLGVAFMVCFGGTKSM